MGLLLAAVIGSIALIIAPGQLFYYDVTPKIVVLFLGTAAVLLVRPPRMAGARAFSILVGLGIASLAVSTAVSVNIPRSIRGTEWRAFGTVAQAAVLLFAWLVSRHAGGRPDRVRTVLRGIAAAGAIASIYGIMQYFGWDPLLPKASYHIGEGVWAIVRPPGTLGYVSYFATWLLGTVFLDLALAEMETEDGWRYAARTAAALAAIAMMLTGTRAAMLGLAIGVAVWLFRRGFRIPRRAMAAGAMVLLAGAAFYYSPAGWPLRSRARWFREDPLGGARPDLWRDSVSMAVHRPLFGWGPEVFAEVFPRFESKGLARSYPDFLYESPHNMFLDAWASQGLPGLAVLAGFCWVGLRMLRQRKEPEAGWVAAAIASVVVAQQFTVFTMPTALLFYLTIALGASMAATGAPDAAYSRIEAVPRFVIAAFLTVAAVGLLRGGYFLERAKEAVERGDVAEAQALKSHAHGADLWFSRACFQAAQKTTDPLGRLRALTIAGAAAQRATLTADDPFNAWYNLAVLYGLQNNAAGAESSLRAAIAARPNWYKPHWMLSQVLRVEGRLEESRRESDIATDLSGGKHPEVSGTQLK